MTMKETLLEAMHVPSDSETARWMSDRGVAVTDVDTMSQAIHDVYCGITASLRRPPERQGPSAGPDAQSPRSRNRQRPTLPPDQKAPGS